MGLFNKKIVVKIEQEDLKDARLSVAGFNKKEQKRAFFNVLSARLAMKIFFKEKLEANNVYSLYTIRNILKRYNVADIYSGDIKFDVRLVFNKEQLFIPKEQYDNGFLPDYYFFIAIDSTMSNVEFLGLIEPENIDKENNNGEYYFAEPNKLIKPDKIKNIIKNFKPKEKEVISDVDISSSQALFLSLADNDISRYSLNLLSKTLLKSIDLRESLVEFEAFEYMSSKIAKNESLMQDDVLSVIGAQQVYEEENQAPVNEKAEIIGEVLSDLIETEELKEEQRKSAKSRSILDDLIIGTAAGAAAGAVAGAEGAVENAAEGLLPDVELNINNESKNDSDDEDFLNELKINSTLSDDKKEEEQQQQQQDEEIENTEDDDIITVDLMEDSDSLEEISDTYAEVDLANDIEAAENITEEELSELDDLVSNQEEQADMKMSEISEMQDLDVVENMSDDLEENTNLDSDSELMAIDENELDNSINELDDFASLTDEKSVEDISASEEENELEAVSLSELEEENTSVEEPQAEAEEIQENTEVLTEVSEIFETEEVSSEEELSEITETTDISEIDEVSAEEELSEDVTETAEDLFEDIEASQEEQAEVAEASEIFETEDVSSEEELSEIAETTDISETDEVSSDEELSEDVTETAEDLFEDIEASQEEQAEVTEASENLNDTPVIEDTVDDKNNTEADIADDEVLKVLFNESRTAEIKAKFLNGKKIISAFKENKKLSSAAIIAGVFLAGVVTANLFVNGINKNRQPEIQNTEIAQIQEDDIKDNIDEYSDIPPESSMQEPMDIPAENPQEMQRSSSKNLEESMSNAFTGEPVSAEISKIAWEIPEKYTYNDGVRQYLQIVGKNLKLNLQNELLLSDNIAYSNKVVIDMVISSNGMLQSAQIVHTSGSKNIDRIVLQSVKNTMMYLKLPEGEIKEGSVPLTLIISF